MSYPFTCPTIDKNIDEFKGILESYIESTLQDVCPLFEQTKEGKEYIQQFVKDIYVDCEHIFENLRSCNADLRKYYEDRIDNLEREKNDLEAEVSMLESKL
jgi:uncharacterized protein (UPF0335 family)